MTRFDALWWTVSESEARVDLNLTPGADGAECSTNVVGEITRQIFEDCVSVSAQGKRALSVTRNCKVWMVEQIVGFRS